MSRFTKVVCIALLLNFTLVVPTNAVPPSRYATKTGNTVDRLADSYCDYVDKLLAISVPLIEKTRESSPKTADRVKFIYSNYLRRWHTYTTNLINRVSGFSDNLLTRIGAAAALNTQVTDAQTAALTKIDDCLAMSLEALEEARNPSGEIRVYGEDPFVNQLDEWFSGDVIPQGPYKLRDTEEVWVIENDGVGPLIINSVELLNQTSTNNDAFVDFAPSSPIQADTEDLVIAPGDSVELILVYTATVDDDHEYDLTINNSDPDGDEDPFVLTLQTSFAD